jgi:hypothetical protein
MNLTVSQVGQLGTRTTVRIITQGEKFYQNNSGKGFGPIRLTLSAIKLYRTLPSAFCFENFTNLAAYCKQPSVVVTRRNERYSNWHSVLALETWNVYHWCVQCLREY